MSLNASCRVCQMTHVSHLTCIPISGIALVSVSLTVTHDRKNQMILNGRKDLHTMVWSRYGGLRLLILCVGIDFSLLITLSYVVLFHKWNPNN